MPSTIIPPGFAQVFFRFRCVGDNEEMLTSIGVRTVGDPPDPDTLADDMATAWLFSWPVGDLSSTYTFVGTRVYVGQDGDPLVAENLRNTSGTGSGAVPPNNCAALLQKRSALGGRRNRGRMFLPAGYFPETGVDQAGLLTAGTVTTLQGNCNDFLTQIRTGSPTTDQAVILHSSAPSAPTVITTLTVAPKIATQRTRMRR